MIEPGMPSAPSQMPFEHFVRFTTKDISQVPARVGIYAWYSRTAVGPADYRVDIRQGRDIGVDRFRSVLQRHTERHTAAPMVTDARGTFSMHYAGVLEDRTAETLKAVLSGEAFDSASDYESGRSRALADSIEKPELRAQLVRALGVSSPVLSAPLYIGISVNLRDRLATHTRQLQRLSDLVRREPTARKQLQSNPKSFAVRAIARGFTEEHLEVWVLDLQALLLDEPDGAASPEELRAVAEAGEWLLNRWHRPYLGKR